ncbi:hypothetical protein OH76DRAFT_1354892 [Lentinus brumalis]|uniref:Uncharacterized protein n=1 Tax=Lentinus brumalis TaxID=2498619 RepID=A0A371D3J8_9APHY|nr:hypothetical protein OH76DRAFT_1354892 [Polyporus brumalis]
MSASQKLGSKDTHPLPLSSTLHDLRASYLDFASLLPQPRSNNRLLRSPCATQQSKRACSGSLELPREARAAPKLIHTDAMEGEGGRAEDMRDRLENMSA